MYQGAFPTKIEEKNTHFGLVVPYLENNQARLGFPQQKIIDVRALFGDPAAPAPHTWLTVIGLWENEYETRTPQVIEELGKIGELLETKLTNIYENSPADNWTDTDRNVLRRKIGVPRAKPVHSKTPIKDKVFFSATPEAEGKFSFVCRTVHDATTASLAEGADGIEVAFGIFTYEFKKDEDSGELIAIPKRLATGVSECPLRATSFKARFSLAPEGDKNLKYINFYLRWINTSHPELNGEWSGPIALDFLP